MEQSQDNHKYDPIDSIKGEIRLLVLEPATNPEDAIRCQIFHESLQASPRYETLSYCWGDAKSTTPSSFMDILSKQQRIYHQHFGIYARQMG
jgi:hypothetical protein